MSNMINLIKDEDFIATNWSGGKTTQIYIYPEDAKYKDLNFKFRISSATVELEKSEFTKLENVSRFITPLDNTLKLTHDHKNYIELKPFQVYAFDGGLDTTSYGIAKDFNLMLTNGAKGNLTSIHINKEYILNEDINPDQTLAITCVYAMNVEIDEMIYSLNPMETLIINSTTKAHLLIKFITTATGNILISKVSL